MTTKEMYDKGIRCKGKGFNCNNCWEKFICIENPYLNIENLSFPKYSEANYGFRQGGNHWEDYNKAQYKVSEDEINKRIEECIHILNADATINMINKSNGDTLIIVERNKGGHYNAYVSKGYKECVITPYKS